MGLLGGLESFQASEFLGSLPCVNSPYRCLGSMTYATCKLYFQHSWDFGIPCQQATLAAASSDACHPDLHPMCDMAAASCVPLCTARSGLLPATWYFLLSGKSHVPWRLEGILRSSYHPRTVKNPGLIPTPLLHSRLSLRQEKAEWTP